MIKYWKISNCVTCPECNNQVPYESDFYVDDVKDNVAFHAVILSGVMLLIGLGIGALL